MRNKGFTMVELAVATGLAALLFVSLFGVVAPVYRIYQRTRAQADALLIAGNVIDSIRTTANIAKEVTGGGNAVNVGNRITYKAENGRLVYYIHDGKPEHANAVAVFDEGYYNGKSIMLDAEQTGANIVSVTVTVSAENMPPASTTAVISPLRRILLDSTNSAVEGAIERAQEIIAANPGATPDDLFGALYPATTPEGPSRFPSFDVHTILTANRLNTLRIAAENGGTAAQQAFFSALTDGRAFYLATYMTNNDASNGGVQAIAFVTDMSLDAVRAAGGQAFASVYFVYFEGTWYMRDPDVTASDCLPRLDGKSEAQLRAYFAAATDFVPADTYRIS